MMLKPKTQEIFDYLKKNGKTSLEDLVTATGRAPRSISGSLTALQNQNFVERISEDGVKYAQLTPEGMAFVPSEDE